MTWIVKDSNGEYYGFRKDAIHWHQEQSKADRFKTREEAEKISKCLNDQHYESRIVKLKVFAYHFLGLCFHGGRQLTTPLTHQGFKIWV
jgi:GH25 family lysozyme M1 (1,4-beta-N-acetylmuramidase)